jgi:hypothetical protein
MIGADEVRAGDLAELLQFLVAGVYLVRIDPASKRIESPKHHEQVASVGGRSAKRQRPLPGPRSPGSGRVVREAVGHPTGHGLNGQGPSVAGLAGVRPAVVDGL